MPVGQQAKVVGVRVPAVIRKGKQNLSELAPVDLHKGHSRFDQASTQKATLPERCPSVAGPNGRRFTREVEYLQNVPSPQKMKRPFVQAVPLLGPRLVDTSSDCVQFAA